MSRCMWDNFKLLHAMFARRWVGRVAENVLYLLEHMYITDRF